MWQSRHLWELTSTASLDPWQSTQRVDGEFLLSIKSPSLQVKQEVSCSPLQVLQVEWHFRQLPPLLNSPSWSQLEHEPVVPLSFVRNLFWIVSHDMHCPCPGPKQLWPNLFSIKTILFISFNSLFSVSYSSDDIFYNNLRRCSFLGHRLRTLW